MPRALIVTPTRELADRSTRYDALSLGTKLRSATIYGGVGAGNQIKALRAGAEILVACPGRLLDLVQQRHAKLERIEVLVLDEADRMFDMGFSAGRETHHQSRGEAPDDVILGDLPCALRLNNSPRLH